ncbi:MAG: tetratricopeptide repeat protein, partial [Verrucomicrobia bacterium]
MANRLRIILTVALLCLGGREIIAASGAENRAFSSALKAFQDAQWPRAESEFARFAEAYPKSERVAEALLLQARARFAQKQFAETISLLQDNRSRAGQFAGRYLYWIGQARFESGDYGGAANCFSELGRDETNAVLRLEASVAEAAARARLGQWPRVGEMLGATGGVFQSAAKNEPENPLVTRGLLLLGEARLSQNDAGAAGETLRSLEGRWLDPELAWQRQQLRTRIALSAGQLPDAEKLGRELDALAKAAGRSDFAAESAALLAQVFEREGKRDEAMAAYGRNLAADVPPERQREALAKSVAITLAQGQYELAEQMLEKFSRRFPDSTNADVATLAIGELQLTRFLAAISTNTPEAKAATTNFLEKGLAAFNRLITSATNSPYLGQAYLDRGWCLWYLGNRGEESLAAFKRATELLGPSAELAIAQLKAGDVCFARGNFAEAREWYLSAIGTAERVPAAREAIGDFAASQLVRACRELKDMACAERGMKLVLASNPQGAMAEQALLQVGQGYTDLAQPKNARELYEQFLQSFSLSEYRPQVELAIARTEEQSGDVPAALARYEQWLQQNPTNALRPKVEFYRAMASARRGDGTNALTFFTNLVAQYPADPL